MQTMKPKTSANEPQLLIPMVINATDIMIGTRAIPIVATSAMMEEIPILALRKLPKENMVIISYGVVTATVATVTESVKNALHCQR